MPRIGLRETVFSVNCFAAAMLALFVSFALGLERPFWAMATVYITSQPLSGAARSKAVYRLIGTVVGAVVTVLLVPTLVNAPAVLSLALALWVAGCQFVSLLDRTPRSYVFMLAGYTAALVGFPSVTHPEAIFDIAVLRVQEIGVGVICAAVIHSIVWPRPVTDAYAVRARSVLGDAEAWIAEVLSAEPTSRSAADRRRLAADVTDLHVIATHIPFDTARNRPTRHLLVGLQDALIGLIPLVSAIEDRLDSLVAEGALEPDLTRTIAEVRTWATDPTQPAPRVPPAPGPADWRGLLALNLVARLAELVDALSNTRALVAALAAPDAAPPAVAGQSVRSLHRDYGLALISSGATLLTILACCGFWIATGWPEGAIAAMIAAVVCCFFATLDDPVPAQRSFLIWTIASLPLAALYLFAILPAIDGFAMLCVALAPCLLPLGAIMAVPAWYGRMVPMMIGFASGLALTNVYTPDAVGFFNANIAQLVGIAAAIVVTQVVRSIGAATAIRRLRRAGWRDLAALADRPARLPAWRGRMLDRVGLIAARVGALDEGDRAAAASALRELRLGFSLAHVAPTSQGTMLRGMLAAWFRRSARAGEGAPPPELLGAIDDLIGETLAADRAGQADPETLAALTGLRRNVFPAAPGWQAMGVAA